MTYRFECRCGKKMEARDEDLGEEVRCPGCGARILLPFTPDGKHGYAGREKLARPALIISLLPIILLAYAAIETALYGAESLSGTVFNILGVILWLGQAVSVILGAVALRRIRKAGESGGHLDGEKEAAVAVVVGSAWLALFARYLLFFFLRV